MTISTTTAKKIYSVGIGEDTFPFTFKVTTESEIVVTEYDASTKVETVKTLTTDYTISLDADGTGNAVFKTAPNAGNKVIITRATPQIQQADFSESEYLKVEDIEDGLDKLTKVTQELSEKIDRTPKLQKSSAISAIIIEDPVNNKPLYWKNGRLASGSTDIDNIVSTVNTAETSTETYKNEAKDYSDKAKEYRDAASGYATTAGTKAGEANTSKTGADTAKTKAEEARDAAAKSAVQAANSASHNLYGTVLDKTYLDSPVSVSLSDDGTLFRIDTSGGNVVVNLPDLSSASSVRLAFAKMTGDANSVVISAYSTQTINGETTSRGVGVHNGVETFVSKDLDWLAFGSADNFSDFIKNSYSGNGVLTDFNLTKSPDHINNTSVYISGVYQSKSTYSIVNSNTIRFSEAPPTPMDNNDNIEVIVQHSTANQVVKDLSISSSKIMASAITNDKLYGGIQGNKISNGVILASHLADGIISNVKLDSSFTVGTSLLENNSVTSAKISSGQIKNEHLNSSFVFPNATLADNSVDASALASNSVETIKIKNAAIDQTKLEAALLAKINKAVTDSELALKSNITSLDGSKIVDKSISNQKLKGGITGDKLSNLIIDSNKLQDNVVSQKHLTNLSVGSEQIIEKSVQDKHIESIKGSKLIGHIDASSAIPDKSINDLMLADNCVQGQHIDDETINLRLLATPLNLPGSYLQERGITGNKIAQYAIGSDHIKNNEFAGKKLRDGSISYAKLSSHFTLPSSQITGTFGNSFLESDAIETDQIKNGVITSEKLNTALQNQIASAAGVQTTTNFIMNGNFSIWQRQTTASVKDTDSCVACDRWITKGSGEALVKRVEHDIGNTDFGHSKYFLRYVQSTNPSSDPLIRHRVENVRTLANKEVTLTYWLRSNTSNVYLDTRYRQSFGAGSTSSDVRSSVIREQLLSTSWVKYTDTFTVSSVTGKDVKDLSYFEIEFSLENGMTYEIDFANIQLEVGSTATTFQEESDHETLLKCLRYYEKTYSLNYFSGDLNTEGELFSPVCKGYGGKAIASTTFNYKVPKCKVGMVSVFNSHGGIGGKWWGDNHKFYQLGLFLNGHNSVTLGVIWDNPDYLSPNSNNNPIYLKGHLICDAELI